MHATEEQPICTKMTPGTQTYNRVSCFIAGKNEFMAQDSFKEDANIYGDRQFPANLAHPSPRSFALVPGKVPPANSAHLLIAW